MTEQEWLMASDPTPILGFLRGKVSDWKLCLFGVARCLWLQSSPRLYEY